MEQAHRQNSWLEAAESTLKVSCRPCHTWRTSCLRTLSAWDSLAVVRTCAALRVGAQSAGVVSNHSCTVSCVSAADQTWCTPLYMQAACLPCLQVCTIVRPVVRHEFSSPRLPSPCRSSHDVAMVHCSTAGSSNSSSALKRHCCKPCCCHLGPFVALASVCSCEA